MRGSAGGLSGTNDKYYVQRDSLAVIGEKIQKAKVHQTSRANKRLLHQLQQFEFLVVGDQEEQQDQDRDSRTAESHLQDLLEGYSDRSNTSRTRHRSCCYGKQEQQQSKGKTSLHQQPLLKLHVLDCTKDTGVQRKAESVQLKAVRETLEVHDFERLLLSLADSLTVSGGINEGVGNRQQLFVPNSYCHRLQQQQKQLNLLHRKSARAPSCTEEVRLGALHEEFFARHYASLQQVVNNSSAVNMLNNASATKSQQQYCQLEDHHIT